MTITRCFKVETLYANLRHNLLGIPLLADTLVACLSAGLSAAAAAGIEPIMKVIRFEN